MAEPPPPSSTKLSSGVNGLRSRAALAMLTAGILVAVPYLVPGLGRLRLLAPLPEGEALLLASPEPDEPPVGEADVAEVSPDEAQKLALPERIAMPPEVEAPEVEAAAGAAPDDEPKPPTSIEDPSGRALDAFFRALERVEAREAGAMVRVSFWGDSNVAGDLVTAVLRRKLQDRYGDGGHGFVLLANPTPYYFHNDVWRQASNAWAISRIPGPLAADGLYGLGGVSFRAREPGAFARIGTAKKGSYGRKVASLSVDYLAHPKGGGLELRVDGEVRQVIETGAEQTEARIATVEVPDGPHEFEIKTLARDVRVFGVWLERPGPAVVVDALGVTSAKVRYLSRIEPAHFTQQLQARNPELFVLNFGVNESREGERQFGIEEYESTMKDVLVFMRKALPDSSCLLVSPNDIAWKTPNGDRLSLGFVSKLASSQRKVAAEVGCAYWDMYLAMGGSGSMGRWVERGLAKPDMLHPTAAGANLLGTWLYLALQESYRDYQERKRSAMNEAP